MAQPERLQKLLARAGVASRRAAEELIVAGRVSVNGAIVTELGTKADPERDDVRIDDRPLPRRSRPVVLALYKPAGYVSTRRDDRGRRTVMDLVPDVPGLHPVGRLDYDTSGLLLLTNDGDLTLAITHPRHELGKTYLATVSGRPTDPELAALRQGIRLEDGMTAPAEAEIERVQPGGAVVKLTIHEGRNRQVRRMLAAVGHPVRQLVRTAIGPLGLSGLDPGSWRELSVEEVEWLRNAVRPQSHPLSAAQARKPKR